jgi:hypothetical protein
MESDPRSDQCRVYYNEDVPDHYTVYERSILAEMNRLMSARGGSSGPWWDSPEDLRREAVEMLYVNGVYSSPY